MRRISFLLVLSCLGLFGCGRAPNPEQQRADSLLVQAREKLTAGRYHDGRELLTATIALQKELKRPAKLAEAEHLLGDIAATVAQYDSAIIFYNRAIDAYKSAGDRESAHALTLEIARFHHRIGENRKAFAMCTEAIRLAKVFENPIALRETEWAILPVCRALDDREEEIRVLSDLLNDATAMGSVRMQAKVSLETGISNLLQGNHQGAEESFFRALTLADQSRDSLLSIETLLRLAMVYTAQGKIPEAFQMYTDGLKRTDVTRGAEALREEMLIRVGNIYLRTKQNTQAALFYRTALNSAARRGNKVAEGYLTIQLGHIAESPAEAVNSYRSALDLFTRFSYPRGSAYVLLSLGFTAQRRNQLSEALNFFKSAVEQYEGCMFPRDADDLYTECESSTPENPQSVYDPLIELLLQSGRYDEAFWYMDRKRARELRDDLGALDVNSRTQDVTADLARFSHLRALQRGGEHQREVLMMTKPEQHEMFQELDANLAGVKQEMSALADRVASSNKAFESMVSVRNPAIGEIQKLLPPGVVLVSHFAAARSVYCFAISSTRAATQVAAIDRRRALSLVGEFRELLRNREMWKDSAAAQTRKLDRQIEELGNTLYGVFVRPIEQDIAGASKLIIVPQREFLSLPVHALRPFAGRAGSPYVIERYAVSYLPSTAMLMLKEGRPATTGPACDIIGMGHPGGTSWDVEYELRDIRAFYKETRLYFDQQATLARLQSEHGDILHVAAAVQCGGLAPGNVTVSLSDGKSVNSIKQVLLGELFSLPPFAAVMLSDLGDPCIGNGPLLASIFLMNGSAAFITNTYPPARKTKKYLSELFYTALLAGATPASAIRQVQLEMIKNRDYLSPHIWAPFVVWGK